MRKAPQSPPTRDNFIYWGFAPESLRRLGALAGFASFALIDAPVIDGNPRLIGVLNGGSPARPGPA